MFREQVVARILFVLLRIETLLRQVSGIRQMCDRAFQCDYLNFTFDYPSAIENFQVYRNVGCLSKRIFRGLFIQTCVSKKKNYIDRRFMVIFIRKKQLY
jgi:hypothetical protein